MALNSLPSRNLKPTDQELLKSFLYNKINNNPLPNHITILEHDLFGIKKNPWEIWEEFEASHSYCGKDLYFFTLLKKKSATSSRMVRTIGMGSWEAEDVKKDIIDKETCELLGNRKRYRFEKSDTIHDNGWILHEYKLHMSLINNYSAKNYYVLCRFRKNIIRNKIKMPRKNTRTKNVGQNRRRKIIIERPETTVSDFKFNNASVKIYPVYETPKTQSNTEQNESEVAKTKSEIEKNNVWLGKNTDQRPTNQVDNGNNNIDVVNTINTTKSKYNKVEDGDDYIMIKENGDIITNKEEEDGDLIMNKKVEDGNDYIMIKDDSDIIVNKEEEDGDLIMNKEEEDGDLIMNKEVEDGGQSMLKPELFAMQLKSVNEGCLIEEEDVAMISNDFYKDLLLENFLY